MIEKYIAVLERLQANATGEDRDALAYAVQKLKDEMRRDSLEMITS